MRLIMIAVICLSMLGCASSKKQPEKDQVQLTPSKATSQPSQPLVSGPKELAKVSCSKAQETRVLEIVKKESGCVLEYRKYGKVSGVASSLHGLKHCEESQKKIQSKLETAGYRCT